MLIRKPSYYDSFHCIASACTDTCCAGWEIGVDEETAARYRRLDGAMGRRIKENTVETEDGLCFVLQGERCPFLNRQNLCDLILELGEDSLCEICREHPRHYEWLGPVTEVGLGLCCEEAGRLLFGSPDPVTFLEVDESDVDGMDGAEASGDDLDGEDSDQRCLDFLLASRMKAIAIVQNREIPIHERLIRLLHFAEVLQDALDLGVYELDDEAVVYAEQEEQQDKEQFDMTEVSAMNIANFAKLLEAYAGLESLDGTWGNRMEALKPYIADEQARNAFFHAYPEAYDYQYEHFAVYLLFRYFAKSYYDGDVLGKIQFVCMSELILMLMDFATADKQEYSFWDRIWNAKQYSKEIEYSQDNMDTLAELCETEDFLSPASLRRMLRYLSAKEEKNDSDNAKPLQ